MSQPSLFDAADRARDSERLQALAVELAQKAGRNGVCVSDLRIAAVNRGLLTGEERGRRLSFLGAVMRKAGLVSTGQYRRSDIPKAHGNLGLIWVAPEYAEQAA